MSKFVVHFEMDIEVDMPNISAKEGELVYKEGGKQTISDDQWNEIVSEAVYYAEDIENNVTAIQCIEEESDSDPEEENEDEIYNNSPEYIHDAAVDWMNEHADFLNDIGEDRFKERCMDVLREEGYNVDDHRYAIDEAFEDMDWDRPEYDD